MEINPHIASGIRKALNGLYDLKADDFANYWLDELHQVNGYPIDERWNAYTLHLIEKDLAQVTAKTTQLIP